MLLGYPFRMTTIALRPIGKVESRLTDLADAPRQADEGAPEACLVIDADFATPETDLDRMLGKYDNALATAHVIPDSVRGNVHFKAFGYRSGKGCGGKERRSGRLKDLPYRHGDFNDSTVAYWRSGFWKPGTAGCEEIKQNPLYVEGSQR